MLNRSRRLRTSAAMRNLVAETDLRPRHLIQPHFVQPHPGSSEIASLPVDDLAPTAAMPAITLGSSPWP